ncbi:eukaryotic translation initiation factor 2 alpha subunit [Tribonema minus]|uniref:Eukaryotic translation initiation factor 2 alpha subunit n=1 Tax=Tribonema minus TaxID=303371 RepID=A0A835YGW1_9STRA|nr:eukaryotic translation initiation factor 2 alpha subunit [Tribonema minus]
MAVEEGETRRVYLPEERARLECRFYEAQFPEIEDVVMVNVRNIADMGAYVVLLEYNNIEGMILLSELSRRRIRSINRLIRVNRNEVAMVLRVDREKGYIDLSKRRVSPEDIAKCEDRYNKAKAVHSILRHVAELRGASVEDLYTRVGWPLQRRYGSAHDAFKLCLAGGEEEENDVFAGLDVDDNTRASLITYIRRRLAPQPIKIRGDIEITCYTYEGVDAIRESLQAGIDVGNEDMVIKIKLIAPPRYTIDTMTLDKDAGKAALEKAIEVITARIAEKGGRLEVKLAPKAVSQREESELAAMMERLALENEEIDGDAPEDV